MSVPLSECYPTRSTRHHSARAYRDLSDWLASLRLQGRADRTLDDYERTIAALLEWSDMEVDQYTVSDLEHFILVKYGPTVGAKTRISHLNSFFGWLHKRERIQRNPAALLEAPRSSRQKVVDVFTDVEITLLSGLPSPDGQLCTLMLYTGIRKSEARNLQRRHVTLHLDTGNEEPYGELVIYQGKGNKDRVVPFGQRVVAAIADLDLMERLNPDDYLWSTKPNIIGRGPTIKRETPISNTAMQGWWKGAIERAGVVYRNMHTTRHTFATRLMRRGARIENVQRLLGHSSIQTTVDIYGHMTIEDARADLRLLEVGG